MGWEPTKVLSEWFGQLDADGLASAEKSRRWWLKDPEFDAHLLSEFGVWVDRALTGELKPATVDAQLALIILLDQFTRNIYRGQPKMYAGDSPALELCMSMIEGSGWMELAVSQQCFVIMPLMHSERLSDQERCVQEMQRLLERCGQNARSLARASLSAAKSHRDIVKRFGRFPHRNAILERSSNPEELAFLKQPGSSF